MDKIFKVALVGCGTISGNHIRALLDVPYAKIVAICDKVPEKAEGKKAEFGLDAKVYDNYEKMLECEDLDSVHIATPHYLHASMAIAALKKNINVFLEKPICISREEIDALEAAEAESSARVCVCFQNRFNPSTVLAKKLADEDGGVISAFGTVFWYRGEKYYTESGWRGAYATEGGGVMINQAIHTIDLLCYYLGVPKTVIATKANHHLKGIIEVEDSCEGMISFDDGKFANFYTTTAFAGRDTTIVCLVTKNKRKIQIQDSKLYLNGNMIEDPSLIQDFYGKECYGNGHMYLIAKYYNALKDGLDMPVTLESASYALRILLAAYKSGDQETII